MQILHKHITATKHILRYLKGTTYLGLKYERSKDGATGCSDADWAGDLNDLHFTSGYIFLLAGAALKDIGMPLKGPTVIHEDNQGAIAIA